MPLVVDEDYPCLRDKKIRNITRINYTLYSIYGQYNTRNNVYCVPMAVKRMNFNVKNNLDQYSSQGRKVTEILRDLYGDETPGRKNPKSD